MQLCQRGLFFLILMITTNSQANKPPLPFNAVQRLFSAISAFDYTAMNEAVTSDFHLLEVGEVWNMDDLINAVKPSENTYERRNFFSVIKTVTNGDMAWVSYWNKATYESLEPGTKAWLESVVLVNIDNQWKIQLLHSTRVDPDLVPGEVVFEEYVTR